MKTQFARLAYALLLLTALPVSTPVYAQKILPALPLKNIIQTLEKTKVPTLILGQDMAEYQNYLSKWKKAIENADIYLKNKAQENKGILELSTKLVGQNDKLSEIFLEMKTWILGGVTRASWTSKLDLIKLELDQATGKLKQLANSESKSLLLQVSQKIQDGVVDAIRNLPEEFRAKTQRSGSAPVPAAPKPIPAKRPATVGGMPTATERVQLKVLKQYVSQLNPYRDTVKKLFDSNKVLPKKDYKEQRAGFSKTIARLEEFHKFLADLGEQFQKDKGPTPNDRTNLKIIEEATRGIVKDQKENEKGSWGAELPKAVGKYASEINSIVREVSEYYAP